MVAHTDLGSQGHKGEQGISTGLNISNRHGNGVTEPATKLICTPHRSGDHIQLPRLLKNRKEEGVA